MAIFFSPSSPLTSSLPPVPLLPPQSTPPQLCVCRKGLVSREYQQNMAYQATVRLSTSPCNNAGQRNQSIKNRVPKPSKRVAFNQFPKLGVL